MIEGGRLRLPSIFAEKCSVFLSPSMVYSAFESIVEGGASMSKRILMKTLLLALTIMLAAAKSIDQVGESI